MPTYEYVCKTCGNRFDVFRSMTDESPVTCGICSGDTYRAPVKTGGVITEKSSGCSFESSGTTCCGASQRCGKGSCGR